MATTSPTPDPLLQGGAGYRPAQEKGPGKVPRGPLPNFLPALVLRNHPDGGKPTAHEKAPGRHEANPGGPLESFYEGESLSGRRSATEALRLRPEQKNGHHDASQ